MRVAGPALKSAVLPRSSRSIRESRYAQHRPLFVKAAEFPAFVRSLPEADLPPGGLRGWPLQGESGQVLFSESSVELAVPQHSHGNQWGIVLEGKIDLAIGEQTLTLTRGDAYFIPAGAPHQARIYPGYRAIDYFADRDRYRMRSHGAERCV